MKEKIMLRSKAKTLEPVVRIGKSGLTDSMIGEINKNSVDPSLLRYEDKLGLSTVRSFDDN